MLLAADIGNTNVVLGLVDDAGDLVASVRTATRRDATRDEISMVVAHLARGLPDGVAGVSRTVVCSVVPSLTSAFLAFVRDELGHEPLVIRGDSPLGIPVELDDPRELGADRLVNALAALADVGAPAVVVDLGTATTFDCVDARGRYVGGIIAPGIETSAEELFRRAARLSKVDLKFPERVIGRNTRDGLRSGILRGSVGMIDGIVNGIWQELAMKGKTIATGGLAPLVGPHCRSIDRVDVNLTLRGLVLADRIHREGNEFRIDGARQGA
jgi:type III pantothenate kinase